MSTVPIVELVGRCDEMAATHRRLFELVGSWVADEPDPARQRLYGIASHRHAWHAELWEQRSPAIPVEAASNGAPQRTPPEDGDARHDWYHGALADLIDDTVALADAVDPTLDPGTVRVARLVLADLADLTASESSRNC